MTRLLPFPGRNLLIAHVTPYHIRRKYMEGMIVSFTCQCDTTWKRVSMRSLYGPVGISVGIVLIRLIDVGKSSPLYVLNYRTIEKSN